jgi:Tfp pilus assembly protein PilF
MEFTVQAQDYFYTVLNRDHRNIYAANGLAIILQEKGLPDDADEVFAQACPCDILVESNV